MNASLPQDLMERKCDCVKGVDSLLPSCYRCAVWWNCSDGREMFRFCISTQHASVLRTERRDQLRLMFMQKAKSCVWRQLWKSKIAESSMNHQYGMNHIHVSKILPDLDILSSKRLQVKLIYNNFHVFSIKNATFDSDLNKLSRRHHVSRLSALFDVISSLLSVMDEQYPFLSVAGGASFSILSLFLFILCAGARNYHWL